MPTKYIVRRVIRVEESPMWEGYKRFRDNVKAKGPADRVKRLDPPALTQKVVKAHPEVFEKLDESINEVYLWHGTDMKAALSIAQNDFRIDLSGSKVGSMFGAGVYMAESCTKSDEYSCDTPGEYYDGVYPLLLSRCVLGKFYYTEKRGDQEGEKQFKAGEVESIVGDMAKTRNTFREIVLFDKDQIYPEYIVLFSRLHAKDNEADLRQKAAVAFQAQLPVYWTNCHKNPFTDSFHEKYPVRAKTRLFLEKLVSECCTRGKKVVSAQRIENSDQYKQYITFKKLLHRRELVCTPINELDGNPSSGHALTMHKMAAFESYSVISLSNIDVNINEMLLWHGTSKDAADAITKSGFKIPRGGASHGSRFGQGAYFAENLDKSLDYASASGGVQYILLCRVLCGDMYYTTAGSLGNAHDKAKSDQKDSVLANPNSSGPREFIVLEERQVYPEFLLTVH